MTIATIAQAVLASDELANTSGKQVKTLSVRVEKNLKDFYVTQARAG